MTPSLAMFPTETIYECMMECRHPLEAASMEHVRAGFARLADACAAAMQRAGLDFDEVLLERYAVVRDEADPNRPPCELSEPSMVDSELWLAAIQVIRTSEPDAGAAQASATTPWRRPVFSALKMRVVKENVPPPFGPGPIVPF